MVTENATEKRILLLLFKYLSGKHTITSLASKLKLSRVGIWKVLKKLESKKYITLDAMGSGKTSASIIKVDLENILAEKALSLYLTEEAVKQRRWRINFEELENEADFTILFGSILHSSQKADDIDLVNIAKKNRFVRIQKIIDKIQKTQVKKIHAINFTETEFKEELKKPNKAFIEAINKGVVLFGQERFVKFMKRLYTR